MELDKVQWLAAAFLRALEPAYFIPILGICEVFFGDVSLYLFDTAIPSVYNRNGKSIVMSRLRNDCVPMMIRKGGSPVEFPRKCLPWLRPRGE